MSLMPATKRHNLVRKLCYDWIRQYEPERLEKFKRIAEIEHPVAEAKGGRRKSLAKSASA